MPPPRVLNTPPAREIAPPFLAPQEKCFSHGGLSPPRRRGESPPLIFAVLRHTKRVSLKKAGGEEAPRVEHTFSRKKKRGCFSRDKPLEPRVLEGGLFFPPNPNFVFGGNPLFPQKFAEFLPKNSAQNRSRLKN